MCILFHFFQVGVYIGIASRIGLKKVVNTPLRDLTNVHQEVDFKFFQITVKRVAMFDK